jgi:hypothetical protein
MIYTTLYSMRLNKQQAQSQTRARLRPCHTMIVTLPTCCLYHGSSLTHMAWIRSFWYGFDYRSFSAALIRGIPSP